MCIITQFYGMGLWSLPSVLHSLKIIIKIYSVPVPTIGGDSSTNTSSTANGDSTPNGLLHGGVVIMVNGRSSFIPIIFGQ